MQAKKSNKPLPTIEEEEISKLQKETETTNEIIIEEEQSELVEGDDLVEMDIENEKKIEYSFSSPDGEMENESEDKADLPEEIKKTGNRYNAALSSEPQFQQEEDLNEEGIFIAQSEEIGLGYGDNDYAKDEEEEIF